MGKTQLITDWVKVATSGRAFDGRVIEPQWLLEMAADYDQAVYTSLMWPEHERWFNYGEVKELEARQVDDKVELYARLSPNSYYLAQNAQKQGLFFSIEVDFDVVAPGRAYLGGLAVTDSPASLGLPPTYFKAGQSKKLFFSSKEAAPLPLELGQQAGNGQTQEIRTLFDAMKSELSAFFNKFSKNHEETNTMEKWEEALAELREEMNGKITAIEERLEAVEGKESEDDGNHSAEDDKNKEKMESEADGKKDEEYARMFAAFSKKLDDIDARFSQAKPGTQAHENTGADDLEPLF